MNHGVAFKHRPEWNIIRKSGEHSQKALGCPTVLIAASDPEIRKGLGDLLQNYSMNSIWVDSVEDVKSVIATMRIATCFCGLWLQDGTYREIVRHLRRDRMNIPVVIVSAPSSPIEYRDYLSAMNIGALDCLCYPYQQSHFEAMIEPVIASHSRATPGQALPDYEKFIHAGAA